MAKYRMDDNTRELIMTADEARDYLEQAAKTATGEQAIRLLGYGAIMQNPRGGDDASSIKLAGEVAALIARQMADYAQR